MQGGDKWNESLRAYAHIVQPNGKRYIEAEQITDAVGRDRYAIAYNRFRGDRPGVKRLAVAERDPGEDAFALLEYLGAESAGSLILLPPGQNVHEPAGLRPLSDEELARRIRDLPRATLSSGAPKRMSLAGAQNKLLVVYRAGSLFEPIGSEPSTHILKPNQRPHGG